MTPDNNSKLKWFTLYTKSRYEKKVLTSLLERNYEVFLPLRKTIRQWSDRKRAIELPLFPSYIFVRTTEKELFKILQINGIVKYITFHKQAAVVRDREIELIKMLLENKTEFEVLDGTIEEGAEITINSGFLKGYKGKIIEIDGDKKAVIEIESLNKSMIITMDINLSDIEKDK